MLVILHGWSDSAASFRPLARRLMEAGLDEEITEIHLGDWLSLDDEVTYDDLSEAMMRAWRERALPTAPRSVNLIVHSTGGLVVRDWQLRFFRPETTPIHRLLMLAPANYGSPLAHMGRSVFGRAVKGWQGSRLFETGARLLKGLELASSYTAGLAEQDWFGDQRWYGSGRVLCTVLIGNAGYTGIRALANKAGSDGAVRVSSANLAAARLAVDFNTAPNRPTYRYGEDNRNSVAFGIIDGEDHTSLCAVGGNPRSERTLPAMLKALRLQDDELEDWVAELAATNAEISARRDKGRSAHYYGYQDTVFCVRDQYGNAVNDYVIEFFVNADFGRRGKRMTRDFIEDVISNVHVYKGDPSRRSFLVNCRALNRLLDRPDDQLFISITATPDIHQRQVGFRTYTDADIGDLALNRTQVFTLFQPNRTLFVDLVLKREQRNEVFELQAV
ncbi:MAG: alpha/beta hydrolase [Wenzhouxiangella sp.]|jgi:hypothetical protein|nr:alpha/beta hydrolase [Wenzhouxiangella sp.]